MFYQFYLNYEAISLYNHPTSQRLSNNYTTFEQFYDLESIFTTSKINFMNYISLFHKEKYIMCKILLIVLQD